MIVLSYLVNSPSDNERSYKLITCIHTYANFTAVQETFHLCVTRKNKEFLKDYRLAQICKGGGTMRDRDILSDFKNKLFT